MIALNLHTSLGVISIGQERSGTSASIQLAQWVEHQTCTLEVDGSIPLLKTLTRTLPRLFEVTRDSHVNPGTACYAVDDGPKVAMPGDRLVNGAGISLRRKGQSTISDSRRWYGRP